MNETATNPEIESPEENFVPPAVSVEIYDQVYHLRGVDPD